MICPRCSVGEISEATQECLVCGFSRTGGVAVETSTEWNRVEDPLLPALERQFAVEGVLRRGSTSRIYLARDQVTGRLCSLKVLPLGEDVPEGLIERFRKDAQRAATLDHPHLVSLLSYGATDEAVWYATEYVQGRSLGDLLRSADRMDLKTCLRLVEQIASALDYGHRRGITHGNLKPANVLVDPEGWARVADLGVSATFGPLPRRAPEQSIEENYGHTAPEQFGPLGRLSPAADQYALAVLAFYCLARRPPIVGDTLEEISRHHLEATAPLIAESRPDLPAYVSSALARALSRAPADRFPGVLDFVTAMSGVVTEEPAAETPGEPQPVEREPEPAPKPEPVTAAASEPTPPPAEAAPPAAAAEPLPEPEPERKLEPEPEPVAAMSEAGTETSTASATSAAASTMSAGKPAAASETASEASTAGAETPAAEPPGPPLLLVERPHYHHEEDDEDEDAKPQQPEPVLLWRDRDHEQPVEAAAAAAATEPAPAGEPARPWEKAWTILRPRLQQVAARLRQLAARWRALPRNTRYGSSAAAAVLVLALVWVGAALAGRDERRPPIPINEPKPTGVEPTQQRTKPPETGRKPVPPPHSGTTQSHNPATPGTKPPADSGARRPPAGKGSTVEPAHLLINSTPWGVLYIDGRQLGNLPQAGVVDVPPGTHMIRILRDGYLPYEYQIAIESGETLRLTDIMLQEKPQ